MREIPLTRGMVALVDDADYEALSHWSWSIHDNGRQMYAKRRSNVAGHDNVVKMHRQLMLPDPGQVVDHINGNGLDNRKANLRIASKSNNGANRSKTIVNTSGYKGVFWHAQTRKWLVKVKRGGRQHYVGIFSDPIDAALAYDARAIELFGEYARPNFLRVAP
jgi:hypothetical protein